MQSMPDEALYEITQELRSVDPNIECVGIDAATVAHCRRPRYWWTNWYVQRLEGEAETARKGVRHLHPWLELGPVNDVLEEGYSTALDIKGADCKYHTFTRCRAFKAEPSKPTGKTIASPQVLKRWAEDQWRYSPYQYADELLVYKGEN